MTTAELCGHRWQMPLWPCLSANGPEHRCWLIVEHRDNTPVPGPCRCRCGATTTTTREDAR